MAVSADGMVCVADRSNNRIQVFERDGTFVQEQFILPRTPRGTVDTLAFSADPDQTFLYNADPRNMKVWILRRSDLEILGSFGHGGSFAGGFTSSAYVVTDLSGNLYVGEGVDGQRAQRFLYTRISDWLWYFCPCDQSSRLDCRGFLERNQATEGDTQWVNYKPRPFSSRSTGF